MAKETKYEREIKRRIFKIVRAALGNRNRDLASIAAGDAATINTTVEYVRAAAQHLGISQTELNDLWLAPYDGTGVRSELSGVPRSARVLQQWSAVPSLAIPWSLMGGPITDTRLSLEMHYQGVADHSGYLKLGVDDLLAKIASSENRTPQLTIHAPSQMRSMVLFAPPDISTTLEARHLFFGFGGYSHLGKIAGFGSADDWRDMMAMHDGIHSLQFALDASYGKGSFRFKYGQDLFERETDMLIAARFKQEGRSDFMRDFAMLRMANVLVRKVMNKDFSDDDKAEDSGLQIMALLNGHQVPHTDVTWGAASRLQKKLRAGLAVPNELKDPSKAQEHHEFILAHTYRRAQQLLAEKLLLDTSPQMDRVMRAYMQGFVIAFNKMQPDLIVSHNLTPSTLEAKQIDTAALQPRRRYRATFPLIPKPARGLLQALGPQTPIQRIEYALLP